MRTTTKRALSTFFYFLPLASVQMVGLLLGILWSVLREGFKSGQDAHQAVREIWDSKHNDPEYRHDDVAQKPKCICESSPRLCLVPEHGRFE